MISSPTRLKMNEPMSLMQWSFSRSCRVIFRNHTSRQPVTTDGIRAGRAARGKSARQFKTPLPLNPKDNHRLPGRNALSASTKLIRWSAQSVRARCESSHSLPMSERYRRSLPHSGFPRQLHRPQYQKLLNRSYSMKSPGMTSSKRCRWVSCIRG